jgi:hypothetical protein
LALDCVIRRLWAFVSSYRTPSSLLIETILGGIQGVVAVTNFVGRAARESAGESNRETQTEVGTNGKVVDDNETEWIEEEKVYL